MARGTDAAAGGQSNGQAQQRAVIKKLTKEKLEEFKHEVLGGRGGEAANLAGRGIETIVSLHGLKHVTKMDLSRNKLTKLADMKRVPNLTMLKLTGNKLNGEGVAEIQHLKKLVILNVAENRVSRISMDVLLHLRSLKALVLNDNAITTLDWIPKLPELNSLIVSNNRISQIPTRLLAKLPNLTKISITHNQLEELPDLSSLTQITELRLSHNKITKIPAHLAKLENLRVLELGHNEIDDWDGVEALSALPNLKQLVLRGNPIAGKPLEVSLAEEKAAKEEAAANGEEPEEETEKELKRKSKRYKKLDATNKHYHFKIRRLFPLLVVRDGQRIMDKKTHGYVAPPKEDKPKQEKPEKKDKTRKDKAEAKEEGGNEPVEGKMVDTETRDKKQSKRERKREGGADRDDVEAAKPSKKKSKLNTGEASAAGVKGEKKAVVQDGHKAEKATTPVVDKPKKEKGTKEVKKDKKKAPRDVASGVVAVKQLKSAKKAVKMAVDFSAVNFAPNVGLGGSSAWD